MYAIVRHLTYDPTTISRAGQALAAAQRLHAAQPGHAGSIVVDHGQHFIAVNLWQSEHDAAAGRAAISTQVQRLLEPLMTTRSQLLGAGEVAATDLTDHRDHATTTSSGESISAQYWAKLFSALLGPPVEHLSPTPQQALQIVTVGPLFPPAGQAPAPATGHRGSSRAAHQAPLHRSAPRTAPRETALFP